MQDLSSSPLDELYIANAGLVILWPFLEGFCTRLGLLAERHFIDGVAAQRAVGLLQYAATGERDFPEYLLPLNKVLCGMEPTDLFALEPPLTDEEAEECDDLLRAVIVQAPILRDMTVAGLRGSFLLRQGVLARVTAPGCCRSSVPAMMWSWTAFRGAGSGCGCRGWTRRCAWSGYDDAVATERWCVTIQAQNSKTCTVTGEDVGARRT